MNWAEKLSKQIWDQIYDWKGHSSNRKMLPVDKYDSAVLEKNKEIRKDSLRRERIFLTNPAKITIKDRAFFNSFSSKKDLDARAFREQVAEVKRRGK